MVKTIKEMAEDYADKHGFRVPYDGSNNYYDKVDVKASLDGFNAGANAVIVEIKNVIIQMFGNDPILSDDNPIRKIEDKIRELKGK